MIPSEPTLLLPRLVWDDPRVHLLDDVWLLCIFAILIAIGLPWLLSGFAFRLGEASLGLLALGAIHLAFAGMAASALVSAGWRRRALALLHITGVVVMGFIWAHAGGLQNPAFLAVFALPVIGAIFVSRWQPYLTAVVAVAVVLVTALIEAPELRWYASGLGLAGALLANLLGSEAAATSVPFSGFYAPSGYFVVLLEVFTVLLFASAVAAEYLGTIFERLYSHVNIARAEAGYGQELWSMLIEQLPLPAVLVDADTLQVVCVSELATSSLFGGHEPVAGGSLFDAIRFSYPEIVRGLVRENGGVVADAIIRVADSLRLVEIRVRHVTQKGRRFALVLIEDVTQPFCVKVALDAAEHAALIVDARGRVLAFNKPASGLFASVAVGISTAALLPQFGSGAQWWNAGFSGRRKLHVEIAPRIYQLTVSAVALPGEEERINVLAFLPVAKAEITEQLSADSTVVTAIPVQR